MKHLIVVRHGDYAVGGILSEKGKIQINSIALQLTNLNLSKKAVILTSPAPRALESADIIKQKLGIKDYVEIPFFWSDTTAPTPTYYKDQDPSKVMTIVNEYEEREVVIVVSHLEVVNQFPKYFMQEMFGKIASCPKLEKGEALHIDVLKQSFKLLKDGDMLLDAKLGILHNCLTPDGIPDEIPQELAAYAEAFDEFKQSVYGCTDCFSEVYIKALTKFRDILLADI